MAIIPFLLYKDINSLRINLTEGLVSHERFLKKGVATPLFFASASPLPLPVWHSAKRENMALGQKGEPLLLRSGGARRAQRELDNIRTNKYKKKSKKKMKKLFILNIYLYIALFFFSFLFIFF